MKVKAELLLLSVAVVVFCVVGWTSFAQRESPSKSNRVVWEYETVSGNNPLSKEKLDELGSQGWELVTFDTGQRGGRAIHGDVLLQAREVDRAGLMAPLRARADAGARTPRLSSSCNSPARPLMAAFGGSSSDMTCKNSSC